MNALKKVEGEKFLYTRTFDDGTTNYYVRTVENGRDTTISLECNRVGVARKKRDDWLNARTNRKLGIQEPLNPNGPPLIEAVLDEYAKAGYPDGKGNPKTPGDHLTGELASLVALHSYWDGKDATKLTQNNWDKYKDWRKANAKRGAECKRQVDLDRNCLSNAIKWAIRKEVMKDNPMQNIGRFHSYLKAVHCKQYSPQSAEELHDALKVVFANGKSEALAWSALFEAATGCRTDEIIKLRMDASPGEPGSVMGDFMKVRRAKQAGRENEFVHLTPEFKIIIAAHKVWHDKYYANHPYFFPNLRKAPNGKVPCPNVTPGALTKCLDHLFDRGLLKRKYTSHAMRAYYVLCRRSWGIADMIICAEINQIGGTKTLEISYGTVPPEWLLGNGPKITVLPTDPARYAWADLLAAAK